MLGTGLISARGERRTHVALAQRDRVNVIDRILTLTTLTQEEHVRLRVLRDHGR